MRSMLLLLLVVLATDIGRAQVYTGDTLQFIREGRLSDSAPPWRSIYGFDNDDFAIIGNLNGLTINGSIAPVAEWMERDLGIPVIETRMSRRWESERLDTLIGSMTGRVMRNGATRWGRRLIVCPHPWDQIGWGREVLLFPFDSAQNAYWASLFRDRRGGRKATHPTGRDPWGRAISETVYDLATTRPGDTILGRLVFEFDSTIHTRRWPRDDYDDEVDGVENSRAFFARFDLDWVDPAVGDRRPNSCFVGLVGRMLPSPPGVAVDLSDTIFIVTLFCEVPRGRRYRNGTNGPDSVTIAREDIVYPYATLAVTRRDLAPTSPGDLSYRERSMAVDMVRNDSQGMGGPIHPSNTSGGRIDIRVVWTGKGDAAIRSLLLRDTLGQLLFADQGRGDRRFRERIVDSLDKMVRGWGTERVIRYYSGDEGYPTMYAAFNWLDSMLYRRYGGGDAETGGIRAWRAQAYAVPSTWMLTSENENSIELYGSDNVLGGGVIDPYLLDRFGLPATVDGKPYGLAAIARHNGGRFGIPLLRLDGADAREQVDLYNRARQRMNYGAYIPGHVKWPYDLGVNGFGRGAWASRRTGRPLITWPGIYKVLSVTWRTGEPVPDILFTALPEASELRGLLNLSLCYGARGIEWYPVGCNLNEFDRGRAIEIAPGKWRYNYRTDWGAPGPRLPADTIDRLDLPLTQDAEGFHRFTVTIDSFYTGWGARASELRWLHRSWIPTIWPYLRSLRWRDGYSMHFAVEQSWYPREGSDHEQTLSRPLPETEIVRSITTVDRFGRRDAAEETYVELGLFDAYRGDRGIRDTQYIYLVNRRTFERSDDVDPRGLQGRVMDSLAEWRYVLVRFNLPRADSGRYAFLRVVELGHDTTRLPGNAEERRGLDTLIFADSSVGVWIRPGGGSLLRVTTIVTAIPDGSTGGLLSPDAPTPFQHAEGELRSSPPLRREGRHQHCQKETIMEDLMDKLVEKTGIDRETANKVVEFLKEHAAEIPGWLGQVGLGGITEKVGGIFGGDDK